MSDVPRGWQATSYGAVLAETHERRGDQVNLPVLSVTKTQGPMLASERFGKVLHGRNLAKYRVARRGSIVADPMLLWDGSIGRQEIVDAGLVSPDYRVYELADHVHSNFMRYVVRDPSMLRHYQGGARGTNVRRNRIARQDFLRIPFRLPPLPEQRKIAAILTAVDQGIEKIGAVIQSLQTLKKATRQELLSRGFQARHTRLKPTVLGPLPETWAVVKLDDVIERVDAGWSPKCGSAPAAPGAWGVLRISAVTWGRFNENENKALPLNLEPKPEIEVRAGDVIASRANSLDLIGRAVLVTKTRPRLMLSDKLLRLQVSDRLLAGFLNLALATSFSRLWIREAATGTSQSMKNISQAKLLAMPVPVPPKEEQAQIVSCIDALNDRLDRERATLYALEQVNHSLVSVLLTGELRVRPDEGGA